MWTYFPELLSIPVPRYTSFPTAAEFHSGIGPAAADTALRAVRGDISIYLHIPFCEQICWYCGCNTGAANRRQRLGAYLDALHHEIALSGARLDGRVRVRRIAFGGGSPNAIAPTDFVRLVDALTLHLWLDAPEWSIELDPRTLSEEWGQVMASVGVTRASMGVQTFAPHLQAAIGRVQPDAMIARGTDLLRRSGVTSLNFDLMYGLPGQTLADLETTLARTVALGADRIALFGYAHVPHLLPRQRRIDAQDLPGQQARFAMAAFGYDYLQAAGYVPVGFDHFAQPGDPLAQASLSGRLHRNFQGFTDDPASSLLGFGASAISSTPELLWQNHKNAGRYRMMLSQDLVPAACGVERSAEDRARGRAIEDLLCRGETTVDPRLLAEVAPRLAAFAAKGLFAVTDGVLRLTPAALPYARSIAAQFDPYRQDSARRFSSAV